ncbi:MULTISPECIES: sigma 54 modulation/S30EA ribosomal C-terminal domain-containing protein [unclassified Kribbella]|uniref:sigma 54 modulation/S30EA ribosomal C-terminal domain-containing protein n=1 Tax=unclassified Kribbella TaxID=2644121 RepID=UPI00301AB1E7
MTIGSRNAVLGAPVLIEVLTDGILPTNAAEMIRDRLAPILGVRAAHSRVRLTRLSEPGLARPVVGQLDVRLAQHHLRAQVAAATMPEVGMMLAARAVAQLRLFPGALAECLLRHSPTPLPVWFPEMRPPGTRQVARHKMCRPAAITIDEAIAALEAGDYRFHLFWDRSSGRDSFVVRTGPGRYRLVQAAPDRTHTRAASGLIELAPALWRTVDEAIARLDLTGAPFEIFAEKATRRVCALYARYDGHYGLLGPATQLRLPY